MAKIIRNEKGMHIRRKYPKIQRNDTCPCGSGKKYKHCCLKRKRKF
jgi:uncharacterized protein YecA (UPF0149 family)